ncbi:MAG: hypothetical protein H0X40_07480 [Chthoniobacterales bacterium]|nr:hypothetical protein [Chthoniobacterales bacterium]
MKQRRLKTAKVFAPSESDSDATKDFGTALLVRNEAAFHQTGVQKLFISAEIVFRGVTGGKSGLCEDGHFLQKAIVL